MKCNDAERYIMLYLDKALTEDEAAILNSHLRECPECLSEFKLYEAMAADICLMECPSAPEGFEAAVMERVRAVQRESPPVFDNARRLMSAFWGVFAIIFGASSLLILYSAQILGSIAENRYLAGMVQSFAPVYDELARLGEGLASIAHTAFGAGFASFSNAVPVILAALASLCAVRSYSVWPGRFRENTGENHRGERK